MKNQTYADIWQKTLSNNEEVNYEFSLGKRYRIGMFIFFGIIAVIITVFKAAIGIPALLLVAAYYLWYLKVSNAYALTNKRVLIHKGWLSTKMISVDHDKITNVTVDEPFVSKVFFNTGSLVIDTAGTGGKEIVLKNIEHPYEVKRKLDDLRES